MQFSLGWAMSRSMATLLVAALGACGGGGDGGSAAGSSAPPTLTVSASSVQQNSAPVEAAQRQQLSFDIGNLPAEGLYVTVEYTSQGLARAYYSQTSNTTADLIFEFRPGAEVGVGTFRDSVVVTACRDEACRTHVAGSPKTIETVYTVAATSAAKIDRTNVEVSAAAGSGTGPNGSVTITTSGLAAARDLVVQGASSVAGGGVVSVVPTATSDNTVRVDFAFESATFRAPGVLQDTVALKVCYDRACTREVAGSPFAVTTRYTVRSNAQPEPGVTALEVASRATLPHDVIDAEFSASLDAVVMVSSAPRNALYVYDMATRAEKQLVLNKLPVAVSVSPDGRTAAVAHDALVTHVDLATVGQPAPAVKLLNLSTRPSDLVLDGRGNAHVFSATDQFGSVRSIAVATNVESMSSAFLGPYAGSLAKLHPAGDRVYAANNGVSPDDIENYRIESGRLARVADSPYHGNYGMCGNLWLGDDGVRIFTACGATFRATGVEGTDMVYAGTLPLSTSTYYGYRVLSASSRTAARELALIEQTWYECQDYAQLTSQCYSHLNLYDSEFLGLTAKYAFPPVQLVTGSHAQRGLFVFHRPAGARVLISRVAGLNDPANEYLLSVMN